MKAAVPVLAALLALVAFSAVELAQTPYQFTLGFKALADQIPGIAGQPLEHAAIKLFYEHDPDLLDPAGVMRLTPTPSVVVYQ